VKGSGLREVGERGGRGGGDVSTSRSCRVVGPRERGLKGYYAASQGKSSPATLTDVPESPAKLPPVHEQLRPIRAGDIGEDKAVPSISLRP